MGYRRLRLFGVLMGKNYSGGGVSIKFKAEITETDKGMKKLLSELNKLKKSPYVDVGVLGGTEKDGTSTVLVASAMEYGVPSKNIPSRSFIRTTVFENKEAIKQLIEQLRHKIMIGQMTIDVGLKIVGEKVKAATRQKIIDQDPNWAPLAVSTVIEKIKGKGDGEVKTLIDTGQMLRSIDYKVNSEGGGE
jgi:hypothetical protein